MQIKKEIYDDINEYCKLNGLKTKDFIHEILLEAFYIKKYGETPFKKNIENLGETDNKIAITNTSKIDVCNQKITTIDSPNVNYGIGHSNDDRKQFDLQEINESTENSNNKKLTKKRKLK